MYYQEYSNVLHELENIARKVDKLDKLAVMLSVDFHEATTRLQKARALLIMAKAELKTG